MFTKVSQVAILFSALTVAYFAIPASTFYSKYEVDNSEMGKVNELAYLTALVESDEFLIQDKLNKANLGEKLAKQLFSVYHEGLSAKQGNGKTGYEILAQPIGGIVSDFSDAVSDGNSDPEAKDILKNLDDSQITIAKPQQNSGEEILLK